MKYGEMGTLIELTVADSEHEVLPSFGAHVHTSHLGLDALVYKWGAHARPAGLVGIRLIELVWRMLLDVRNQWRALYMNGLPLISINLKFVCEPVVQLLQCGVRFKLHQRRRKGRWLSQSRGNWWRWLQVSIKQWEEDTAWWTLPWNQTEANCSNHIFV